MHQVAIWMRSARIKWYDRIEFPARSTQFCCIMPDAIAAVHRSAFHMVSSHAVTESHLIPARIKSLFVANFRDLKFVQYSSLTDRVRILPSGEWNPTIMGTAFSGRLCYWQGSS